MVSGMMQSVIVVIMFVRCDVCADRFDRIVLASTSRYRREQLARLGVDFVVEAPAYVEEHDLALPPKELVRMLALNKAKSLAERFSNSIIIGSDQAPEIEGHVLGKPGDRLGAEAQLRRLAGRSHRLLTAVALVWPSQGLVEVEVEETVLTMRALEEETIRRYVAFDRPFDCAGAYKIESLGVALFKSIEGQDPTAVVGLSLLRLARLFRKVGVDIVVEAGSETRGTRFRT